MGDTKRFNLVWRTDQETADTRREERNLNDFESFGQVECKRPELEEFDRKGKRQFSKFDDVGLEIRKQSVRQKSIELS